MDNSRLGFKLDSKAAIIAGLLVLSALIAPLITTNQAHAASLFAAKNANPGAVPNTSTGKIHQNIVSAPFQSGDIFAGVGSGMIAHYSSSGVLINTLDTTSGSAEQTGMCFDATGHLYATNFEAGTMSKFDNMSNLVQASWGGPFSSHPESCVLDSSGNIYVGEVDGANQILKFAQNGTLLASYSPNTESRGLDWIDLAADQCTMYYTSEGSGVHRFNVCTNTQLPDLTTGLAAPCYALRVLSSGEVLVACANDVYRIDTSGGIAHTYPKPSGETSELFAMNINPDGNSFWTAGYTTGNMYHIDISSGALLSQFNVPPNTFSVAGITIFGEPTQGCAPNCPQPVSVSTQLSATQINLGGTFTDNATLSHATSDASGTITYNVYNSTAQCNGTPLLTSTTAVANAKATPSDPFKPTVAGTYNVQAVYSGDSHNNGAQSDCSSETVVVLSNQHNHYTSELVCDDATNQNINQTSINLNTIVQCHTHNTNPSVDAFHFWIVGPGGVKIADSGIQPYDTNQDIKFKWRANLTGQYTVNVVYYDKDGHQFKVSCDMFVSFFVLPESSVGAISLMGSSVGALGAFMFWKKRSASSSRSGNNSKDNATDGSQDSS